MLADRVDPRREPRAAHARVGRIGARLRATGVDSLRTAIEATKLLFPLTIYGQLAAALNTPKAEAERMKQRHGCAMTLTASTEPSIEVPGIGGRASHQLSQRQLAEAPPRPGYEGTGENYTEPA